MLQPWTHETFTALATGAGGAAAARFIPNPARGDESVRGGVGVHRQTVNLWLKRYRAQGVLDGRRVSPRRGKGLLTADEVGKVRGWIADRTPDQRKLPFALALRAPYRQWTSRAVRELIELQFGKRLGLSTVQLDRQRWGMAPQNPLARAKERLPAAIEAWLESSYPAIAKRAKVLRAVIYWGDESGISNQDQIGRSYAPKGQTPVIRRTARRITQSMISAVSNRGLMRFMLYEGALNAALFIGFLRRLIKDAGQKVVLIVDTLRVHHAKPVQAWVASHAHEIEICSLPSYAPDHNPGEYLNNDLKQKLRQQPQQGSKDDPIRRTRSLLRAIQRSPKRGQAYFKPQLVRSAA
jgi:transposase